MTKLLRRAFEQASRLSKEEQEALARWLLDELASERRWEELLDGSSGALDRLADEARAEYRAGETQPLDVDSL